MEVTARPRPAAELRPFVGADSDMAEGEVGTTASQPLCPSRNPDREGQALVTVTTHRRGRHHTAGHTAASPYRLLGCQKHTVNGVPRTSDPYYNYYRIAQKTQARRRPTHTHDTNSDPRHNAYTKRTTPDRRPSFQPPSSRRGMAQRSKPASTSRTRYASPHSAPCGTIMCRRHHVRAPRCRRASRGDGSGCERRARSGLAAGRQSRPISAQTR